MTGKILVESQNFHHTGFLVDCRTKVVLQIRCSSLKEEQSILLYGSVVPCAVLLPSCAAFNYLPDVHLDV